jgi:hypothetical protein
VVRRRLLSRRLRGGRGGGRDGKWETGWRKGAVGWEEVWGGEGVAEEEDEEAGQGRVMMRRRMRIERMTQAIRPELYV